MKFLKEQAMIALQFFGAVVIFMVIDVVVFGNEADHVKAAALMALWTAIRAERSRA